MNNESFIHPERDPRNCPGPFYSIQVEGMDYGIEEELATNLLSEGSYFSKQPQTPEEIDQACDIVMQSYIAAFRYGGKDPDIIRNLHPAVCDYSVNDIGEVVPTSHPSMQKQRLSHLKNPISLIARLFWRICGSKSIEAHCARCKIKFDQSYFYTIENDTFCPGCVRLFETKNLIQLQQGYEALYTPLAGIDTLKNL